MASKQKNRSRSFRPSIESLEARELMAANLTASFGSVGLQKWYGCFSIVNHGRGSGATKLWTTDLHRDKTNHVQHLSHRDRGPKLAKINTRHR